MILDDDARVYLTSSLEVTVDPTGSTVELEVGSTRYPMAWVGSPVTATVKGVQVWRQDAKTTYRFCGSSATAAGTDVALTAGTHRAQPIVTLSDGQVLPGSSQRVEVQ